MYRHRIHNADPRIMPRRFSTLHVLEMRDGDAGQMRDGDAGQMRDGDGVDPKLETLKIGTPCSERRFGWQLPVFSLWNLGLP
jgi:hypothetical protein